MKTEYDFSKSRKNPCTSRLKRQVTIRLDDPTIDYFKQSPRNPASATRS